MILSNKEYGPQTFSFYDGCVRNTVQFPMKTPYEFRHSVPSGGADNFRPYCPLLETSSFTRVELMGSCNGLFCLLTSAGVFLWNPALNKVRLVETEMSRRSLAGGLCFDPQTMEFKIVTIGCDYSTMRPDVLIYSTSTNSSKTADVHNYYRCWWTLEQNYPAPFVAGALHWYAERLGQVILCFDVSQEAFREINVPALKRIAGIKEFQGTISCFLDDQNDQSWEVWVMKEYGVEDSWAKLYTVGYSHGSPLEIMNGGEVMLISSDGEFLLFDPTSENQGRKVEVKPGCQDMVSYKGSLALLNEKYQSRICPFCCSTFIIVLWNRIMSIRVLVSSLWSGFQQHYANLTERSTIGSEG